LLSVEHHERSIEAHETDVVVSEQGNGHAPGADPRAARHVASERSHDVQRDAHDRIKQHHHRLIAELRRLVRVLEEAV
jgi:hypothetical protein